MLKTYHVLLLLGQLRHPQLMGGKQHVEICGTVHVTQPNHMSLPGRNCRTKTKTSLEVLWTNTDTLHKTQIFH